MDHTSITTGGRALRGASGSNHPQLGQPRPDPRTDGVNRRSFLAAALAAGAGLSVRPDAALARTFGQDVGAAVLPRPWTAYQGAVQDTPGWSSFQRGGNFATAEGDLRAELLRTHLQTHDLLSWAAPHDPFREYLGLARFMDLVRITRGAYWRQTTATWVADMIAVHAGTPHKVIGLENENEINDVGIRNRIAFWAAGAGLPFPHPRSNYNDGAIMHSRDHIGYYVEYVLAPAVEGLRWANGPWPESRRIPAVLGTVVGARHPRLRDVFLPALLEYQIEGTFAPSLAGKRVKQVVDYIALQYLLTPEVVWGYEEPDGSPIPYGYKFALSELHSRWVGNGTIKGIWHTEEGGNLMHGAEQLATTALRTFARVTSWALQYNATPQQIRVAGYYKGGAENLPDPRHHTSWSFALDVLQFILGYDSHLIDRSGGTFTFADAPIEKYGFETGDGTRRLLLVTPESASWQGNTNLGWVGSRFDTWTTPGSGIRASAHLFSNQLVAYTTFPLTVTRNTLRGWYDIYLPNEIALNEGARRKVLVIALDRSP